jgi:riboflavin transporter
MIFMELLLNPRLLLRNYKRFNFMPNNENVNTLVDTKTIMHFLGISSIASILPFFIHLQWVTGPLVNALLILMLFFVGYRSAIILCFIPSLMALSGGLIPAILAPGIPFIMLSNVLYISVIQFVINNNRNERFGYWIAALSSSILKFLFLFASISFIIPLFTKKEITLKIAQMMSWPQMFTAFTGAMIAWLILRWFKKI